SRMRLHVGILGTEQLLGALPGKILNDIGELAAAVVALAGIAFGVFVGEHAAGGFKDRLRSEVLAGDQFQVRILALSFMPDGFGNLRIHLHQRPRHAFLFGHASSSIWDIFATRRSWRPPSKDVSRKACTSSPANVGSMNRAPRVRTLALLWARVRHTSSSVTPSAALTPRTLFAAMDMPTPLPQTNTPRSAVPFATAWATRRA